MLELFTACIFIQQVAANVNLRVRLSPVRTLHTPAYVARWHNHLAPLRDSHPFIAVGPSPTDLSPLGEGVCQRRPASNAEHRIELKD